MIGITVSVVAVKVQSQGNGHATGDVNTFDGLVACLGIGPAVTVILQVVASVKQVIVACGTQRVRARKSVHGYVRCGAELVPVPRAVRIIT